MTRNRFMLGILAAFGVGKTQQWKECVPENIGNIPLVICTDKYKPALNNQCPVCGTMAEPYKHGSVVPKLSRKPKETSAGRKAVSAPRAGNPRDRGPAEAMKSRKGWGVDGESIRGTRLDPVRTGPYVKSAPEAPFMHRAQGQ